MLDIEHGTDDWNLGTGGGAARAPTPEVNTNAAALVAEREPQTPRERWRDALGGMVGDAFYKLVTSKVTEENLLRWGRQGLDRAIDKLSDRIKAQATVGLTHSLEQLDATMMAELLTDKLRAELQQAAQNFLSTGEGKRIAETLPDHLKNDPTAGIVALLLVAALAYANDMKVPTLRKKLSLGPGLTASIEAQLGTMRNIALDRIGAEVAYEGKNLSASVSYQHLKGDAVTEAANELGAQAGNGFDDHASVDRLRASITGRFSGGSATLSTDNVLQHGKVIAGRVGGSLNFTPADGVNVGLGADHYYGHNREPSTRVYADASYQQDDRLSVVAHAEQSFGERHDGRVSVGANYRSSDGISTELALTRALGNGANSTGVEVRVRVQKDLMFEGRYDKATGGYVGVVFRKSF